MKYNSEPKKVFSALSPYTSLRDVMGQAGGAKRKIFVAMSGGVDSSVAAALLSAKGGSASGGKERGFDVTGIHIKMWSPSPNSDSSLRDIGGYSAVSPSAPVCAKDGVNGGIGEGQADSYGGVCKQQYQDRLDAMRVAAHLGIPFETWDFTKEYREEVVDYMIREYREGRTPNPDVMCNRHIKFGVFLARALERGADFVATGHYVRKFEIRNSKSETNSKSKIQKYKLLKAKDLNKDQSYFLWTLTQEQLTHSLFPIGEFRKPEVRELARKFGLPTAEKEESQGICFIGEIDLNQFLKKYIPVSRGRVFTTSGKDIGEHEGLPFYTIGQREGLGIGGGIPYYVASKDFSTNTLVVAEGPYDKGLFKSEIAVSNVHWISGRAPEFPLVCEARIRYRQSLQRCLVLSANNESISNKRIANNSKFVNSPQIRYSLMVRFASPQRAVTPGQSIVFYSREEMIGGGIID